MFARVSIYEIPEGQRRDAEQSFEEALERIGESEGLEEAYFLLGCDGDRAIAITFWNSHAAMAGSRVRASRLRSEAAKSVDGEIVSVGEFEVAKRVLGLDGVGLDPSQ